MKKSDLFRVRAKRVDSDEWVEGYYLHYQTTWFCFKEDYDAHPEVIKDVIIQEQRGDWGLPTQLIQIDIDPNTLEFVEESHGNH